MMKYSPAQEALRDFYLRTQRMMDRLSAVHGTSPARLRLMMHIASQGSARFVDLVEAFGFARRPWRPGHRSVANFPCRIKPASICRPSRVPSLGKSARGAERFALAQTAVPILFILPGRLIRHANPSGGLAIAR